jgi:hypothetical protein
MLKGIQLSRLEAAFYGRYSDSAIVADNRKIVASLLPMSIIDS